MKRSDNAHWGLPGGYVEPGESVVVATQREVREETGYEIEVGRLVGIYSDPTTQVIEYGDRRRVQAVNLCFEAVARTQGELGTPQETLELGFFDVASLPTPFVPIHEIRVNDAETGTRRRSTYDEGAWPGEHSDPELGGDGMTRKRPTKFIFVTGGVLSSLGKGLSSSASLGGTARSARALKVTFLKLDPYLNVDPGTMNPFQHGEVYVTDDGAETDLDLGHYERFSHARMGRKNNMTAGKIYDTVLARSAAATTSAAPSRSSPT